jgi:(R,R)-butanediol dehydrogenase/meso-butanediol dehydrogenase/diacetyl reductase
MRAAFFHGPDRPVTIEQIDEPRPGAGEVLLKVCRCGVCGSDVSMTKGPICYPLGPIGHEYSGEVLELGAGVTGLAVGDPVARLPQHATGQCGGCRFGNPRICPNRNGSHTGF